MESRIGTTSLRPFGTARKILAVVAMTGGILLSDHGQLFSRSPIIIASANSGNKNAVFFQKEEPVIKLRSLEDANAEDYLNESLPLGGGENVIPVDIRISTTPPTVVRRREFSIPFPSLEESPDNPIEWKGLLYSTDQGKSWNEYGELKPASESNNFVFTAPTDGEYWFALRLVLRDKTESASRGQKFLIVTTGEAAPAQNLNNAPPEAPKENTVKGLLSLTSKSALPPVEKDSTSTGNGSGTGSQTASGASKEDPLTARLNNMGSESVEGKDIDAIPHPGKIKQIRFQWRNGAPSIDVLWFTPRDMGEENSKGTVRIERASSPDGPWTLVSENAKDLDFNGPGYYFTLTDAKPFYLRTVSEDQYGQTWISRLPEQCDVSYKIGNYRFNNPLDPGTDEVKPESQFSNVSAETPLDLSAMKNKGETSSENLNDGKSDGNLPIQAWNDSGEEKDHSKSLAETEKEDPVINKTASINQSSPDSARGTTDKQPVRRPQLTDPNQMTINPIFNYGFGVFSGKDRQGNPLPDYNKQTANRAGGQGMTATMTGASTNFGNGEGQNGVEEPNIPPPPKRSIFMSQAEYRRVQEEYEYEVEQAKRAAQMRSQAAVFNPNGQIGGTQVTIKDAQGNPVTVSEGSVVYLDVNGNFSTTPFSNQPMVMNGNNVANGGIPMNASPEGTSGEGYLQDSGMGNNFGPLTFPDQNFDFQNAAQTTPIQGNMIDPLTNPAATSNNYGPQFQNSSLSSGSPYTQVEERLGGESYLPSPQQTPVDASSLPPRPETRSN